MKKEKIKVCVLSKDLNIEEEIEADYNVETNKIYYQLSDKSNNCFSYNEHLLIRETEDMFLELKFEKNKITSTNMYLKKINSNIDISIKTLKYQVDDLNLEIEYQLNDEIYKYKIIREGD